jgi:hypothetical protein
MILGAVFGKLSLTTPDPPTNLLVKRNFKHKALGRKCLVDLSRGHVVKQKFSSTKECGRDLLYT